VVRDRDGVVWELERPLWGRTSREQLIVDLVAHGGGHPKMAAQVLPLDVGRDLARRSRAEIRSRRNFVQPQNSICVNSGQQERTIRNCTSFGISAGPIIVTDHRASSPPCHESNLLERTDTAQRALDAAQMASGHVACGTLVSGTGRGGR